MQAVMSAAIIMMIAAVIIIMMVVDVKAHPVEILPAPRKELAARVKARLVTSGRCSLARTSGGYYLARTPGRCSQARTPGEMNG